MLVGLQRFDIADAKLQVAKPERRRPLARDREHPGRLVDRDYAAGGADAARSRQRRLADSGGEIDYAKAIPLTGAAGSITVHHVRAVHGSAPNTSNKERRLLLLQYRAADAWPLLGFPSGVEAYDKLMVAGASTIQPRLEPVPVRLPLPPADLQGSIYENQKGLKRRFFEVPEGARQPELQPAQ